MPRAPIVIPFANAVAEQHWRRFVAAFCFTDCYFHFVLLFNRLWVCWLHYDPISAIRMTAKDWYWEPLLLAGIVCMFGLGRALCRNGRVIPWLVAACGILVCRDVWTLVLNYSGRLPWSWDVSALFAWGISGIIVNVHDVVTLTVLAMTGVLLRGKRPNGSRARNEWVLLAVPVALVWLFVTVLPYCPTLLADESTDTGLCHLVKVNGVISVPPRLKPVLLSIPLVAVLCLMRGWRAAILPALAMVCIEGLPQVVSAYTCTASVHWEILGILRKSAYPVPDLYPWPWLLFNSDAFQSVCIQMPQTIMPWLLIAWFAWRVPMNVPPEDGSPYPRRYCGRCGYNLHGVTAGRCPECGEEMLGGLGNTA